MYQSDTHEQAAALVGLPSPLVGEGPFNALPSPLVGEGHGEGTPRRPMLQCATLLAWADGIPWRPAPCGGSSFLEGALADLTSDDVLKILDIIDKSEFDFFALEMGDLKVTVSKTGAGLQVSTAQPAGASLTAPSPRQPAPPPPSAAAPAALPAVATPTAPAAAPTAEALREAGLVAVHAPMVGTFYAQPEPGAPPYVQVGSAVEESTTLGLIEVMKVFNAIQPGVAGVVAEILARNGQFVEFGQVIFLIRPTP